MPLFLILYSLFFIFLAWRRLKWAIYLICFTLPAYLLRFQLSPVPMTVLEVEISILFLVWIVKTLKHKNIKALKQLRITNYELLIPAILFFLTATIAIFVSPDLRSAAGLWKAYFLEPLLFFIVFISVIKKDDLKNVFKFLSLSVFLLSLFAIYQKFTGAFITNPFWSAEATRRVTSIFPYPNALALFLTPIVVVMIGVLVMKIQEYKNKNTRIQENKNIKKEKIKNFILVFFYSCIFIVAALAIYWTKSKGAMLAILAGLIFYAIFFKGHRKIFIGILVVAIFSFFLFFLFSHTNLANTLKGTSTVEGGDSINTRIDMWRETWQMLKTRPILGVGLSGYQAVVAPFHQKNYIEIYLYPHNIFLNFWTEIGLFGLLAFLGIVVWFYRIGFSCHSGLDPESQKILNPSISAGRQVQDDNKKKLQVTSYKLQVTIMAGMAALLAHGLVDVPYFKNDLSVLFWILVGSIVVLSDDNLWKSGRVVEGAALEKP